MSTLLVCPRCGQDYVRPARLVVTGEAMMMCDECLAVWALDQEITKPTFTQLSKFAADRGLPPDTPVTDVDLGALAAEA